MHWIDLYDADNRKIDPSAERPQPYSPEKTCGRCHDYQTISHGWHFDALETEEHGRPGQPWIWTDEKTGTHLPLSYRGWQGTIHPDDLGMTRWQIAAKLGGFLPGGGVGAVDDSGPKEDPAREQPDIEQEPSAEEEEFQPEERSHITGSLPVDCMICHRNTGSGYSPFVWTEQIEEQNFGYAPTAALGLGTVSGSMRRLKDDFDPSAEGAEEKLPKVTYEAARFRSDGKVFIDLVRKPKSDACYYCHTNVDAQATQGDRWLHDEDVHIRAGLACADCHRNGLDHQTIRGFPGEDHAAGDLSAAFSCQGCHMPNKLEPVADQAYQLAGRFGAPQPAHRGLPPLHFEKMSCTACHSGPLPGSDATRQLNSIAHHLGEHVRRTGEESPAIFAGLQLKAEQTVDHEGESSTASVYTPHRMLWPSFWGTVEEGGVQPLHPDYAYELVRKTLKVKKDFTEDLGEVKLALSQRKEILGDDRARVREEERTEEEQAKIEAAEEIERKLQVQERMVGSLAAIEAALPGSQAVYVTGGAGFVHNEAGELVTLESEKLGTAAEPYAWPLAHNVRPARQSLGITGCQECHSEGALFFNTTLTPVGLLPDQKTQPIAVHELQGTDMVRLTTWSQMFEGRSTFKALGLGALGLASLIVVCAISYNLGRGRNR